MLSRHGALRHPHTSIRHIYLLNTFVLHSYSQTASFSRAFSYRTLPLLQYFSCTMTVVPGQDLLQKCVPGFSTSALSWKCSTETQSYCHCWVCNACMQTRAGSITSLFPLKCDLNNTIFESNTSIRLGINFLDHSTPWTPPPTEWRAIGYERVRNPSLEVLSQCRWPIRPGLPWYQEILYFCLSSKIALLVIMPHCPSSAI